MASPTRFVSLASSARHAPAATAAAPSADPRQLVEITVRLRRKSGVPFPQVSRLGATPPAARRHLTHDELAAAYGASEADLDAVIAYATHVGLDVIEASAARRMVVLSGTLGEVCKAFPADVRRVEHGGVRCRRRVGHVSVPDVLAGAIEAVFGLSSHPRARPYLVMPGPGAPAQASRACGPASAPARESRLASEVAALYDFPAGFDGRGQCIGLIQFGGGYRDDDLRRYFSRLGVHPEVVTVPVGGHQNTPGIDRGADGEVALDIEVAGSVAPGARIAVYFADWTERGWIDALNAAIHDRVNKPSVISISWGWAELEQTGHVAWTQAAIDAVNAALEEAALLGITVICASGDDGATDGVSDARAHVDFPASSPWVLSCGGTALRVVDGKLVREVVWNEGLRSTGRGTTGGGVSDVIPMPAWQADANVPLSMASGHAGRGVPDVAGGAAGQTGYTIHLAGRDIVGVAGTSAVAPLYAGLVARLNQALGKRVGYLNPFLYRALAGKGVCRDITEGTNDATGKLGAYHARAGWDPCTGLGSIIGTKLLEALRADAPTTAPRPAVVLPPLAAAPAVAATSPAAPTTAPRAAVVLPPLAAAPPVAAPPPAAPTTPPPSGAPPSGPPNRVSQVTLRVPSDAALGELDKTA
jgi:kumamolisin